MKTAFVLGGFNIHPTGRDGVYPLIEAGLRAKGYAVIPVGISWRRKTPTAYLKEFIELYNAQRSEESIIIGNSFGALVVYLAAPLIEVEEIYLCSVSPFLRKTKENCQTHMVSATSGIRHFGKRRMQDLWSYSADDTAAQINGTGVHVLYGEQEHQSSPYLVARCKAIALAVPGADIHEIAGAPHDMPHSVYSQVVVHLIPAA